MVPKKQIIKQTHKTKIQVFYFGIFMNVNVDDLTSRRIDPNSPILSKQLKMSLILCCQSYLSKKLNKTIPESTDIAPNHL